MAWQREKFDAGYGALTWSAEFGGAGLGEEFAAAFDELESGYVHPPHHETFSVTLHLVAPTLAQFGQSELRSRLLPRLLRTEALSCQLFSEPGPAPTSARWQLGPSATVTPGSSMGRRRGARERGSPSGASSSSAPITMSRSTRG